MRKFTKFFFALLVLCCMAGVQSVNAATEKVYATFENPFPTGKGTWTKETKTFTWEETSNNQLKNIGLPNGDITKYQKLVIDCEIQFGDKFRILFYKGNDNKALWVEKSGISEFDLEFSGIPEDFLSECTEICISGNSWQAPGTSVAPGSIVINSLYLETYDDEAVDGGIKQVHATFAAPQNSGTNTSWDATSKTFAWTTTSGNQLRNIGLPNGDITKFKKLVVDCTLGENTPNFRILIYQGGSNQTLTVSKSGITEFILEMNVSEDFLKNCTEICLSGSSNGAGSAIINGLYLETYPEGEAFKDNIYLTAGMFHKWNAVDADAEQLNETVNSAAAYGIELVEGTVYGDVNVNEYLYADLTGYNKMIIKGTSGLSLRVLINSFGGSNRTEINPLIGNNGKVEIDLSSYDYVHLNAIKLNWGNTGIVNEIILSDEELIVVDGENFNPNYSKYHNATYSRTVDPQYNYGTICLPFAPDVATCENYTFYRLAQAAVDALTFEEVAEPEANIPYLYSAKDKSATTHTFTGGYTEIESEPETYAECGTWMFFGTFVEEFIPVADFGGMMLFYAYKPTNGEDVLVKATNSMTVMPYRAYFIGQETGIGGMEPLTTMRIVVRGQDNGDGTTSIEEIITPDQVEGATPAIYDLMGRPVQQMQKGQIYIVNGKKVVY